MVVVHHNNYYKPYPPLLTSFRGLDLGSTQQRALNRRSKAKTQLEITNLFLVVATFFDSQSIPTILEARAGDIQHGKTTPITHFLFNFIQKKTIPALYHNVTFFHSIPPLPLSLFPRSYLVLLQHYIYFHILSAFPFKKLINKLLVEGSFLVSRHANNVGVGMGRMVVHTHKYVSFRTYRPSRLGLHATRIDKPSWLRLVYLSSALGSSS